VCFDSSNLVVFSLKVFGSLMTLLEKRWKEFVTCFWLYSISPVWQHMPSFAVVLQISLNIPVPQDCL
jgi:hypothetical protein